MVRDDKRSATHSGHPVPERKQTGLGLYVTAREAYEMWEKNPETVNIIDVRTPEEYVFVGHAEMARNIPIIFVKHQWNAEINEFVVVPNPDFISQVKARFTPTDTLLVMCRSGDRSALSVNALAKAGFVKCLQHHRWHGRGQGGRPRMRIPWEADEERVEELRVALDI